MTAGDPDRPVALVGSMGVGKTAVGWRLARHLGRPFVDTDGRVEVAAGCTVADLFERHGEAAFRAREASVLAEVLAERPAAVVATGGGIVLAEANRQALHDQAVVVWLDAAPEVLASRVGDGRGRPLLSGDPLDHLRSLDGQRRPWYREVADLVVDAGCSVDDVVAAVVAALAENGVVATDLAVGPPGVSGRSEGTTP